MSDNVPGTAPLGRLRRYLESDPKNLHLLAYAASAAFDEEDFVLADEFIGRHESLVPLAADLANLKGLRARGTWVRRRFVGRMPPPYN